MGIAIFRRDFDPARLARKSKSDILWEHNGVLRALGRPELTFAERKAQEAKTNVAMAHDVAALMRELPPPPHRLTVGQRVGRDDGRFYIPINRTAFRVNDDRSITVCRVASDAFDDEAKAVEFAEALVDAYNLVVAG